MPVFAPEPEVAAKISILPPEASLQFWIAGLSNNSIVAGFGNQCYSSTKIQIVAGVLNTCPHK